MKARIFLALTALLITGAQAQFKLEDLGNLAKSKDLPGGLGNALGKVQEYAGGQSADDEARSGDTIACLVTPSPTPGASTRGP